MDLSIDSTMGRMRHKVNFLAAVSFLPPAGLSKEPKQSFYLLIAGGRGEAMDS